MRVSPLSAASQPAALAFLRTAPYRNALPLSNITQLRTRCDVLVAEQNGAIVGVVSTYHDLPIANLTFATRSGASVGPLVAALADRNPRLRDGTAWALLPGERYKQLAPQVRIDSVEIEYQMVVEPEQLRMPDLHSTRRLSAEDTPQMNELALAAGLSVWHHSALALGPAFGCFAGEKLVAMAATHFATSEIVEIGHVATHPDYRRRGYASACTAAITQAAFKLAPRVFLMVLEHNVGALAAYKQLGFRTMEQMFLTSFTL